MKASKQTSQLTTIEIVEKIYIIRGIKVMLDKDLAEMYGVETRALNQAVQRNLSRFPHDFMFQVTEPEFKNLISQIVTSSWGGTRKMPYAFTEQGVAMPARLLSFRRAFLCIAIGKSNTSEYTDCKGVYANAAIDTGQ